MIGGKKTFIRSLSQSSILLAEKRRGDSVQIMGPGLYNNGKDSNLFALSDGFSFFILFLADFHTLFLA